MECFGEIAELSLLISVLDQDLIFFIFLRNI